jgi:hypothetical protein
VNLSRMDADKFLHAAIACMRTPRGGRQCNEFAERRFRRAICAEVGCASFGVTPKTPMAGLLQQHVWR